MNLEERMDTMRRIKEVHDVLCERHKVEVRLLFMPVHLFKMYYHLKTGGRDTPSRAEGLLDTHGKERIPHELVVSVDGFGDPGYIFCHEWHHIISLLRSKGKDDGGELDIEGPDKIATEFGFKKSVGSAKESLKGFFEKMAKDANVDLDDKERKLLDDMLDVTFGNE